MKRLAVYLNGQRAARLLRFGLGGFYLGFQVLVFLFEASGLGCGVGCIDLELFDGLNGERLGVGVAN